MDHFGRIGFQVIEFVIVIIVVSGHIVAYAAALDKAFVVRQCLPAAILLILYQFKVVWYQLLNLCHTLFFKSKKVK